MEIKTTFNIGDPLWWAHVRDNGTGPDIAEICRQDNAIDGIKATASGTLICSKGNEYLPGSQYACLTEEDSRRWVRKHCRGAIVTDPDTTVKAVYTDASGMRSVIELPATLDGIARYVPDPVTTEPDADGNMAICQNHAREAGLPVTTYITDAHGNVVDAMFGEFLLVKLSAPDENGLLRLVDIGGDITRWLMPSEKPSDACFPYDPASWTCFADTTVDDLCAWLKNKFRGTDRIHVCGVDRFYVHYAPGNGAVNLDCDALSELDEYDEKDPASYEGTAEKE